jgi:hypothetical protein
MGVDSPDWTGTQQNSGQVIYENAAIAVDPYTFQLQLPGWCRTLFLVVPYDPTTVPDGPNLAVTGTTSGFTYVDSPLSIKVNGLALFIVSVAPALDPEVTVTLSNLGLSVLTTASVIVSSDPNGDDVHRFEANLAGPIFPIGGGTAWDPSIALPRPLPVTAVAMGGLEVATAEIIGVGNTEILAAPAANHVYVLKRLTATGGTQGDHVTLYNHDGSLFYGGMFWQSADSPGSTLHDNLDGLIVQDSLNVHSTGGAGTMDMDLFYDTVVLPIINQGDIPG